YLPSGENVSALTSRAWPWSRVISLPLVGSQRMIAWLLPAVASRSCTPWAEGRGGSAPCCDSGSTRSDVATLVPAGGAGSLAMPSDDREVFLGGTPAAVVAGGTLSRKVARGVAVNGSHRRTVPSQPALASVCPSGEKATAQTAAVCPLSSKRCCP